MITNNGWKRLAKKQHENAPKSTSEKLQAVSNTNSARNERILHEIISKGLIKSKILVFEGPVFSQYEKQLQESNQVSKIHEICFVIYKVKKMYYKHFLKWLQTISK